MQEKLKRLREDLKSKESILIAFSGGVDSSFLLKIATDILGNKALGITIQTPYMAKWEIQDAKIIAKEIGARHKIVNFPFSKHLNYNPQNRCYICKHSIFTNLLAIAKEKNISYVAEGSNVDDTKEHRPGRIAIKELGISTPLLEAGLFKSEIRALSRQMKLKTWDKPSYPCLLTRFTHDYLILKAELLAVEKAELLLIKNGYRNIRVRTCNYMAKIEMTNEDLKRFFKDINHKLVLSNILDLGFLKIDFKIK